MTQGAALVKTNGRCVPPGSGCAERESRSPEASKTRTAGTLPPPGLYIRATPLFRAASATAFATAAPTRGSNASGMT